MHEGIQLVNPHKKHEGGQLFSYQVEKLEETNLKFSFQASKDSQANQYETYV